MKCMPVVFLIIYLKTTKHSKKLLLGCEVLYVCFGLCECIYIFQIFTCFSLFLIKDETPPIPWNMRCKIVQGTANGINFLHENNHIHRDIKR